LASFVEPEYSNTILSYRDDYFVLEGYTPPENSYYDLNVVQKTKT